MDVLLLSPPPTQDASILLSFCGSRALDRSTRQVGLGPAGIRQSGDVQVVFVSLVAFLTVMFLFDIVLKHSHNN